ncbi:hypothetical protein F5Y18DRAFT_110532 [Xylariaceae sp. FL1019]|nr:hypothetical protein F5Y18DRAFT_110532 [Xylariaceae sp. FL1019]
MFSTLTTKRLTLVPLTSNMRTAYDAIEQDPHDPLSPVKSFDEIVSSADDIYRRTYAILLTSKTTGLLEQKGEGFLEDQRKCIGVVGLLGSIVPTGQMRGDEGEPWQFTWHLDIRITKDSRRNGYAREACEATMRSLAGSSESTILCSQDQPQLFVYFVAHVPRNDTAVTKLMTQLGLQRDGQIKNWRGEEWDIMVKFIMKPLPDRQGNVRLHNLAPPTISDRWDRSSMPEPLVTHRLTLLPVDTRAELAYKTVAKGADDGSFESLVPFHKLVAGEMHEDCRSYCIFRTSDLEGQPRATLTSETQQKDCIGILSFMGQLKTPHGDSRQIPWLFEWQMNITIVSGARKQGFAKESAEAAIEAFLREGRSNSRSNIDSPRFDVKGFLGLGKQVIFTARYHEKNMAAESLVKALGFDRAKTMVMLELIPDGGSGPGIQTRVREIGKKTDQVWTWTQPPASTQSTPIEPAFAQSIPVRGSEPGGWGLGSIFRAFRRGVN